MFFSHAKVSPILSIPRASSLKLYRLKAKHEANPKPVSPIIVHARGHEVIIYIFSTWFRIFAQSIGRNNSAKASVNLDI